MDPQTPMSCINCQAVTTNDGRTVWVCEQCGTENPVAPENQAPVTPDFSAAQAAISAAVAGTDIPAAVAAVPSVAEPVISQFPSTSTPAAPPPAQTDQPSL